jgi:hypothetical protein
MSVIRTVCGKEIFETLRDRRTLLGLGLGPLFGPVFFAVLINLVVSRNLTSIEETLAVPMLGDERAPNLVAYLKARGIEEPADHGVTTVEEATRLVGTTTSCSRSTRSSTPISAPTARRASR